MRQVLHDFVIIEPEVSTGVLKTHNDNINSGIVKDCGKGYYTESGMYVAVLGVKTGDKILFTQHLEIDQNGEKVYIVRWRDIIRVEE